MSLPNEIWDLIINLSDWKYLPYKSFIRVNKQLFNITKRLSDQLPDNIRIQFWVPWWFIDKEGKYKFIENFSRKAPNNIIIPKLDNFEQGVCNHNYYYFEMRKSDFVNSRWLQYDISSKNIQIPLPYNIILDNNKQICHRMEIVWNYKVEKCWVSYTKN